jgi:hypothetical protein
MVASQLVHNQVHLMAMPLRIWYCNLKTMVDVFLWMKVANPNSAWWLNWWRQGDSMTLKNLFMICFYIWCVSLICKLWRRELGELVSVMKRNPSHSMKTLHGLCKSRF